MLLVVHQFFPDTHLGTERYTLELAQGLRRLGHAPTVLTVGARGAAGDDGPLLASYVHEGVPVLALDGSLVAPTRFEDTFSRRDLRGLWQEVLWEVRPDVVHACHLLNHTPEFLVLARETGVPVALTLTDFWGICWAGVLVRSHGGRSCNGPGPAAWNCVADWAETHPPTTWPVLNRGLRRLRGTPLHDPAANALQLLPGRVRRRMAPEIESIRRRAGHIRQRYECADAWIAPSQYLLDQYVAAGYPRERFERIPYGIARPDDDEREALDARFGPGRSPELPLRIGYMGQIAPHKGVLELADAFAAAGLANATLELHGDPDRVPAYTRQLEARAARDPRIALRGPYPSGDVYRVLATLDVLAIPSLWHENAPLVLLSALASGTPVVVPRARGMVEFVRPEQDGLVYGMNDTAGLARCLARLEREPELLPGLAAAQKRYEFSQEDCARATLEVYRRIGAGRRSVRFARPPDRVEPSLVTVGEGALPDCWEGGVLEVLGRVGARGFELWLPRARRAPRPGARPGSARATLRRRLQRLGSVRAGMRVAYHGKPWVGLWSWRPDAAVELDRHPAYARAACVEIVARFNRGNTSVLRYRTEDGLGGEVPAEFSFSWPKGTWSRLRIPLVTRRGHRVRSLRWVPVVSDGRSPLKLDVLELAFRAHDAERGAAS